MGRYFGSHGRSKKMMGLHYKVFTPFYQKGCLQAEQPRKSIPSPSNVKYLRDNDGSVNLNQLKLLPIYMLE